MLTLPPSQETTEMLNAAASISTTALIPLRPKKPIG